MNTFSVLAPPVQIREELKIIWSKFKYISFTIKMENNIPWASKSRLIYLWETLVNQCEFENAKHYYKVFHNDWHKVFAYCSVYMVLWVAKFHLGLDILIFGFSNFIRLDFVYIIQVCLKGVEYWIYTGNVFSFTIVILFLISFLGILLVWSDI